ncbi:hypothetical protein [Stenotrophomonas sp.]|uniref:hypothetical protein n=1 Tax=Stenotrophomonas sp. TaxID=69392 RepID=UPI0025F6556D|nr:hypothetical protein [Stenotrophomonas sp.]MBW8374455.1 hypothetical protein [Stenotrophomonas sp.]
MFADVVSLYRESGRPAIAAGVFSYDGAQKQTLMASIEACKELPSYEGFFESEPEEEDGRVLFEWKLAVNECGRFYASIEDFAVQCEALGRGAVPANYYLQEEDFLSTAGVAPEKLTKLLEIVRLIQALSKLSFATSTGTGWQRLLFVLPAGKDAAPRTVEVDTKISLRSLDAEPVDAAILFGITSADADMTLHVNEHRQLFRTAIATVLARRLPESGVGAFEYLIENWSEIVSLYQLNADCYVQNFSFEKMRAEIGRIELDYATRVSAILGESSSKLLALPLSVAGLAGVVGSNSFTESALLIAGMVVVALILSGVIQNQLFAAERVEAGFRLAISDMDGGSVKYPDSLVASVNSARQGFERQLVFLQKIYAVVRPLAWAPAVLGTAIMAVRFEVSAFAVVSILWACALILWVASLVRPDLISTS